MEGVIINSKNTKVYIQLQNKVSVKLNQKILLSDIAKVYCKDENLNNRINEVVVNKGYRTQEDSLMYAIEVIDKIDKEISNLNINIVGETELLLKYEDEKKPSKVIMFIKVLFVCVVLGLGGALAIVNFHEDANMDASFKSIYFLVTGKYVEKPLVMHIPYSIGLCSGVFVFFNHIWSKRHKQQNEPSPLDIEIHSYEEDINKYTVSYLKNEDKAGKPK